MFLHGVDEALSEAKSIADELEESNLMGSTYLYFPISNVTTDC
jgi:hypothetical protein